MNGQSNKLLVLLAVAAVGVAVSATPAAAAYVNAVMADNPLVYLRFEETAGIAAANLGSLGSTHNGTYANGVLLGQTGPIITETSNNAIRLDGNDDKVDINSAVTSASFGGDNSYSIEVWFNQPTVAAGQDILAAVNVSGQQHGILLETASGAKMRYLHRSPSGGSGGENINPSSQLYTGNEWHHLVAVVDSGSMELYLDGVPHSGIGPTVSNPINFNLNFVLGRIQPANSTRDFNGFLDEFALYNQALSQSRVLAHFNAATVVPEPATLLVWSLLAGLGIGLGWRRRN